MATKDISPAPSQHTVYLDNSLYFLSLLHAFHITAILWLIFVLLITLHFLLDTKNSIESGKGSFDKKYWYCLIALLFFPLCFGATWYYYYRKRQIQTTEINQRRQRQTQVQGMENADALFVTENPSVTVVEEAIQDQLIVADVHITIVSSDYEYQTAIILTDEEISLHSTAPLCSAEIVLWPSCGINVLVAP